MNTQAVVQEIPTDPRQIQENISKIDLQLLAMHKHGIYNEETKATFESLKSKRYLLYQQLTKSKPHVCGTYRT